MNDNLRNLVAVVFLALGAWKGWTYYQGRNATHQLVFKADGPVDCDPIVRTVVGGAVTEERLRLPWDSDPVTSTGHSLVEFSVRYERVCAPAPERIRCDIERDGVAWKSGASRRLHNERGEPGDVVCEVSSRATAP